MRGLLGAGSASGFQETWKRLGELEQELKDSCDLWASSKGKRKDVTGIVFHISATLLPFCVTFSA